MIPRSYSPDKLLKDKFRELREYKKWTDSEKLNQKVHSWTNPEIQVVSNCQRILGLFSLDGLWINSNSAAPQVASILWESLQLYGF